MSLGLFTARARDYETINRVAEKLPINVLQENETLLCTMTTQ